MVDYVLAKFPVRNKNYLRPLCGLPVSSYYSALKMRWLIDNLRPVKNAMREKRLMIGTLDTWIVWVRARINHVQNSFLLRTISCA